MADAEQAPKDLFGFLDFYLVKKAPFQIPDAGREFIVRFGPWIAIVFLVFLLPPILFVLGLGTFLLPFGGVGYATNWGLAILLLIVQVGLLVAALPGLFARRAPAWRLLVYSQLIGMAHSLVSGAIIAAIIGGAIGLYILFQIRTLYHE
jgi:hypothetical protein